MTFWRKQPKKTAAQKRREEAVRPKRYMVSNAAPRYAGTLVEYIGPAAEEGYVKAKLLSTGDEVTLRRLHCWHHG